MIKLTNRKRKAILALFNSRNIQEAADVSGVGVRTLHRWMSQSDFKYALQQTGEEFIHYATKQFIVQMGDSISTIVEIRDDAEASHGVRLKAAHSVIDYSLKLFELTDLVDRVANLEAFFDEPG